MAVRKLMTWVKICGTTNLEDALIAVEAGADAVGFVFYEKSPRNISVNAAREIVQILPKNVEKVGVFAGDSLEHAVEIGRRAGFDALQVYLLSHRGQAGSTDLQAQASGGAQFRVYLALPVTAFLNGDSATRNVASFTAERPAGSLGALFLDSGAGTEPGGTGRVFDWKQAAPAVEKLGLRQKVVIAGGLRPDNVGEAITILQPWGVDVASGVESTPGKKDPEKVRAFVKAVREIDRKTS
jgi:phosphoribosylanthranilate isomerase